MKNRLNTILIVDDDNITNYVNTHIIKRLNCAEKILAFQKGKEALEYIKNHTQEIELIFLDINMPGMDGWEFLEEYKNLNLEKSIIIFMLTSSMNPSDKEKASGIEIVKGYITKPLQIDNLQEVLETYFSN